MQYYSHLFHIFTDWEYPTSMDNMIRQWHSIEQVWFKMEAYEANIRHGRLYERVGLFRSDVYYTHPISICNNATATTNNISSTNEKQDAVIPSMMYESILWGGFNERLFYGKRKYAKHWATKRFSSVNSYITWQKQQMHQHQSQRQQHQQQQQQQQYGDSNTMNTTTTATDNNNTTSIVNNKKAIAKQGLHSEDFMRFLLTIQFSDMPLTIKDMCFQRIRSSGKILTDDCEYIKNKNRPENENPAYLEYLRVTTGGSNNHGQISSNADGVVLTSPPPPPPSFPVIQDDKCVSPEKNATWILDGTCLDDPFISSSVTLSSSSSQQDQRPHRTCGSCGENAAYLRLLRDEISAKYKEKCKELVVYGAAFGESYEQWMRDPEYFGGHSKRSVELYNTCFFSFVGNSGTDAYSIDNSQILIHVDSSKMPYKNDRRNVKMLKLNPGLLFPWAKRIIWQDAKLLGSKPYGIPVDYHQHFKQTVDRFQTCSSYQALPHHKNTVFDVNQPLDLMSHCKVIIAAAVKRPTVSDSLAGLMYQCELYYKKFSDQSNPASQVFHQHPLIDSAVIVWDMRTEACRQYNGNMLCSWMNEIHCHTDRDQVSYSAVLASSGVHLVAGSEVDDRVYANKDNVPMVHISKRSCHWYYRSFSRCINNHKEILHMPTPIALLPAPKHETLHHVRVAVIVAGTMQRFQFQSTVDKLVHGMIRKDNAEVDYYLSLTTKKAAAYRSGTYMSYATTDPIFENPDDPIAVEDYVRTAIGERANIGAIIIQHDINIDSDKAIKERRAKAKEDYPDEDPDLRFPLLDIRSKEIGIRTTNANRNLLKMHFAIQALWWRALEREKEIGVQYDYVIFMRDDSLWLSDFSLKPILEMEKEEVFVPSCDAREPPMDISEINDHIIIAKRSVADLFGNYYGKMFGIDAKGCMDRLAPEVTKKMKRGCNSEMLLKYFLDKKGIKVGQLPQSIFPFQRSATLKMPDGTNKVCFHKFCQSKSAPLSLKKINIEKCKDVVIDDVATLT